MKHWLRIAFIAGTLIISILIGILACAISTNEGTSTLWQLIESRIPEIKAEAISGNLWHGVQLKNIRFENPSQVVSADKILVEIDFRSLLRGEIIVRRLALGELYFQNSDYDSAEKTPSHPSNLGGGIFLRKIAINKYTIQALVYQNTGATAQKLEGYATTHYDPEKQTWILDSETSTDFMVGKLNGHLIMKNQGSTALLNTKLAGKSNAGNLDLVLKTKNLLKQPEFTLAAMLEKIQPITLIDRDIGSYELHVNAEGSIDRITGELDAKQSTAAKNQPIDRLAFSFSFDSNRLQIYDLAASIQNKEVLRGNLQTKIDELSVTKGKFEITGLNLHAVNDELMSTNLSGDIDLQADPENTKLRLNLSDKNLGKLQGSVAVTPKAANVETLNFHSSAGSAEASGKISFVDEQRFTLRAKAHHLNPGQFVKDFNGNLNFQLFAEGTMNPVSLDSRIQFSPGSQLLSETLDGKIEFNLMPSGIAKGSGRLSWGQSAIELSSVDKSLTIKFDRINPKLVIDDLDGEFSGNTHFVFNPHSTRFELAINSPEVSFQNGVANQLFASANGNTANIEDTDLRIRVDKIALNNGQTVISQLDLEGSPSQHRLRSKITRGDIRAAVSVSGAYYSPIYRGHFDTLDIEMANKTRFSLDDQAFFEVGPKLVKIGPLAFNSDQSLTQSQLLSLQLEIDLNHYKISTRGSLNAFQLKWLGDIAPGGTPDGDLSAEWNISYDNSVSLLSGKFAGKASELKLPISNNRSIPPLKFENALFTLAGLGNRAGIDLAVEQNNQNGFTSKIDVEELPGLKALIAQNSDLDAIQLTGKTTLALRDLSILDTLVTNLDTKSGQLEADIRHFGTLGEPKMDGTAQLTAFEFLLADSGFEAVIPQADLLFDKQQVQLTQCQLITPATHGKANASGTLSLASGQFGNFEFDFKGSNLRVFDSQNFKLVLSPDLHLSGTVDKLEVAGEITVVKGLFKDLSQNNGVSLSPDVIVLDAKKTTDPLKPETAAQGIQMQINVTIPDSFHVQYAGADILLGGHLKIFQKQAGIPMADGRLAVVDDKLVKNTYTAYGQILRIKKGSVLFARSPINDPGLNIVAVRDVSVGEVGVHVTGTVGRPEIQLESNPAMADSEILSWLVLGRPSSEAGKGFGALLLAVGSEFSGSSSLIDQTRNWMGLDELSFESQDDSTTGMVTLGKRIGENLYLNYQQGILQQGYKIRAIYRLTPSWSAIGESGLESNAVEIEWKKRF